VQKISHINLKDLNAKVFIEDYEVVSSYSGTNGSAYSPAEPPSKEIEITEIYVEIPHEYIANSIAFICEKDNIKKYKLKKGDHIGVSIYSRLPEAYDKICFDQSFVKIEEILKEEDDGKNMCYLLKVYIPFTSYGSTPIQSMTGCM